MKIIKNTCREHKKSIFNRLKKKKNCMQDSQLLWLPAHIDSVNANGVISFRITFSSNRHYSIRTVLEWKVWMEISQCYGAIEASAPFKKFKKMMNIDRCWKATSVFCWSSNAWFSYLASGIIQILCNSVGVLSFTLLDGTSGPQCFSLRNVLD